MQLLSHVCPIFARIHYLGLDSGQGRPLKVRETGKERQRTERERERERERKKKRKCVHIYIYIYI